jgi:hypothetical protein
MGTFPGWGLEHRASNPVSVKNLTAIETSTIVKLLRPCVPVGTRRTSKYVSNSEFCRHNPLCCLSTSGCCCCLFRYRFSPETFGYTLVYIHITLQLFIWSKAQAEIRITHVNCTVMEQYSFLVLSSLFPSFLPILVINLRCPTFINNVVNDVP